ncbi:kinase-like protein [Wolfiporia cocos MD-104 SS10]|uniref:non-specific serine/threonine protein kinase n=1 Tax=Wolfiporia cocos (strain MD-104) TaxID=742152 RepID=A0A2H3JRI1_WOLCO|nr:kinase-like protein [Wolfiporia cocos MD-104 SS10]
MSHPWNKRKSRLRALLNSSGNEEDEALALDRLLHGQNVIGKTAKTAEVDALRFSDKDVDVIGTLEYGQYGVIDVVTCKLDGCVYVRKSIEKRFALKTREAGLRLYTATQCSPKLERDILLRARETKCKWAPHLLCAFQTPSHLNLVMDYAEGGTLWDVLESSPHEGKLLEQDLRWWAPQMVSAIHWCHSQGFVHRDIKPHNFVLTPSSHLLLIDFGAAAPLLPSEPDGSQKLPRQHCLVPCGTCDYISPDILQAHEEALVALEMSDQNMSSSSKASGGYGRETDWWSMGAMLYEMAYGVAPFYADDIRQTYLKITDHYRHLKFSKSINISSHLQDLLRRLLTSAELRLGRASIDEIRQHPFFRGVDWSSLTDKQKPHDLHLPQFTYSMPVAPAEKTSTGDCSEGSSQSSHPFAFSAFFQSSPLSTTGVSSEILSQDASSARHQRATSAHLLMTPGNVSRPILRDQPTAAFIGFSWGPPEDAFTNTPQQAAPNIPAAIATPRSLPRFSVPATPLSNGVVNVLPKTPLNQRLAFATPIRGGMQTPFQTLAPTSAVRRTVPRRPVSDREAMKQLVNCIGMSARKKVLESGRKPRVLTSRSLSVRPDAPRVKELRFDRSVAVVGVAGNISYRSESTVSVTQTNDTFGASLLSASVAMTTTTTVSADLRALEVLTPDRSCTASESDAPPSPSPSPRPGSAMSLLARRIMTPTSTSDNPSMAKGPNHTRNGAERRKSITPPIVQAPSLPPTPDSSPIRRGGKSSGGLMEEMEGRYDTLLADLASIESRLRKVVSKRDQLI